MSREPYCDDRCRPLGRLRNAYRGRQRSPILDRSENARLHPSNRRSEWRRLFSGNYRLVINDHDVLVLGAGLAGMRAALEAARAGADVAIVTKVHPIRSHSSAAQGGINAALGKTIAGNRTPSTRSRAAIISPTRMRSR